MKEVKSPKKPLLYYYGIVLLVLVIFNVTPMITKSMVREVDYGTFMSKIEDKKIEDVQIEDNQILFTDKDDSSIVYKTGVMDDPTLTERLYDAGAKFSKEIDQQISPLASFLLTGILPLVIFIALGQYMGRKMMNQAGGKNSMAFGMGKSNAKVYVPSTEGIHFSDVAGEEEAKENLQEIVDYLHNPEKYTKVGASMPKGVLLVGPPGKKRDGQMAGGNDEREQTLNQLLTEMDGFGGNNGVIILAATNRPESLDPALTRPGRFDRRVPVELPDLEGREAILKVHAKKVQLSDDVDFHTIARMASGASGAELANIVNEAALRAVRDNREVVTEADLEESIEVVIAGYQKKNAVLSDQEKKVVAYHEIGHALVAAMQMHSAPVQKITIIPRTSGALGYTMQVEQGDKYLLTKKELENKIATFTGGRAAEEVVFGEVTTGASNDIEQATKIARSMITRYGMSDDFDMVAMETVTNQYLGGDASLACSADTQKEIDRQVVELVKREHEKAKKILLDNRQKLDELSNYLYEKETITGDEFMAILNGSETKEANDHEKTV